MASGGGYTSGTWYTKTDKGWGTSRDAGGSRRAPTTDNGECKLSSRVPGPQEEALSKDDRAREKRERDQRNKLLEERNAIERARQLKRDRELDRRLDRHRDELQRRERQSASKGSRRQEYGGLLSSPAWHQP